MSQYIKYMNTIETIVVIAMSFAIVIGILDIYMILKISAELKKKSKGYTLHRCKNCNASVSTLDLYNSVCPECHCTTKDYPWWYESES